MQLFQKEMGVGADTQKLPVESTDGDDHSGAGLLNEMSLAQGPSTILVYADMGTCAKFHSWLTGT